jgi:hypothetical protein
LEDEKEHGYAATLKRDAPWRMPVAAWLSPSITCHTFKFFIAVRFDRSARHATSLKRAALVNIPAAAALSPSMTAFDRWHDSTV